MEERVYDLKNDTNNKSFICFNPKSNKNLEDIQLLIESDDSVSILPSREDVEADKYYKHVSDHIYGIIKRTNFLCKKGVNHGYIQDSFQEADAVIMIGSDNGILPNGNVFGFATIVFDEAKNAIYIDVICSHVGVKGTGNAMIRLVENLARKLFMTSIYLKSLKPAIGFYLKNGFVKKSEECESMCLMVKKIDKTTRTNSGTKRRSSRKSSSRKSSSRKSSSRKSSSRKSSSCKSSTRKSKV